MASISQLAARLVDLFGNPANANPAKLMGNLQISPAGNVLVGTSTDDGANKLQVNGNAKITGAATLYSTSTAAQLVMNANGYTPVMRSNKTNSSIEWVNSAGSAVTLTLGDGGGLTAQGGVTALSGSISSYGYGGNVGQGLLSLNQAGSRYLYYDGTNYNMPGAPLLLSANQLQLRTWNTATGNPWYVGADSTSAYCIYANGGTGVFLSWGATAWGSNSDERLKNIRSELTNATDAVKSIRTITYSWKKDDDHCEALGLPNDSRVYVGVIAQDVQKVLPEAVDTETEHGYLGVRYAELTPLALAAIKELTARIEALEEKLAKA